MADFDGPNTPPLYDPMEHMREMEQMRRGRRDKGPERDPDAPETEPVFMTPEQQIRAKALEAAIRMMEHEHEPLLGGNAILLLRQAEQFEHYIREGK